MEFLINKRVPSNDKDQRGVTPLMIAAELGRVETVRLLVRESKKQLEELEESDDDEVMRKTSDFVATDGRGGVHLSGLVFAERDFGFVLPTDGDLIEPINRALLRLIENGDYAELHNRWFGSQPGGG